MSQKNANIIAEGFFFLCYIYIFKSYPCSFAKHYMHTRRKLIMEELIKRLDKPNIRVKTKDKVPKMLDWVNYTERQRIWELLSENGEYGLRTGTKLGNYWFCCLDLDKRG